MIGNGRTGRSSCCWPDLHQPGGLCARPVDPHGDGRGFLCPEHARAALRDDATGSYLRAVRVAVARRTAASPAAPSPVASRESAEAFWAKAHERAKALYGF